MACLPPFSPACGPAHRLFHGLVSKANSAQCDPETLARLRDYRCKKSGEKIAKALRGDWREKLLFTLRQLLEAWRFHQHLLTDCDEQIANRMDALEDRGAVPAPMTHKNEKKPHEEPMREQVCEKFGIDLIAATHQLTRLLWEPVKSRRPYDL